MAIVKSGISQEELMEIKRRLKAIGITQKSFAEKLGYSKEYIYGFLSGWLYSRTAHKKIIAELERLEKALMEEKNA